jgi:hypothetical protein
MLRAAFPEVTELDPVDDQAVNLTVWERWLQYRAGLVSLTFTMFYFPQLGGPHRRDVNSDGTGEYFFNPTVKRR